MIVDGKAWVVGDDINTDLLAPGHAMRLPPEEMAQHTLEAVKPGFASSVTPGDILVAGENFGCGSSREQAAISLSVLGVGAVIGQSFARIFYRNAINIGLPVISLPKAVQIQEGDPIKLDLFRSELFVGEYGQVIQLEAFHPRILEILQAGGLMNLLKQTRGSENV